MKGNAWSDASMDKEIVSEGKTQLEIPEKGEVSSWHRKAEPVR
jgi:hypothetical protein